MDSTTAAFFMCQAQLQQSPIQDATTTKRVSDTKEANL